MGEVGERSRCTPAGPRTRSGKPDRFEKPSTLSHSTPSNPAWRHFGDARVHDRDEDRRLADVEPALARPAVLRALDRRRELARVRSPVLPRPGADVADRLSRRGRGRPRSRSCSESPRRRRTGRSRTPPGGRRRRRSTGTAQMSTFTPPVDRVLGHRLELVLPACVQRRLPARPGGGVARHGRGGAAADGGAGRWSSRRRARARLRRSGCDDWAHATPLPASGPLGRRPAQGHTDVRMSRHHALQAQALPDRLVIASGSSSPAAGTRAFAIPAASPSRAASTMPSPRARRDRHAAQERVAAPDGVAPADAGRDEPGSAPAAVATTAPSRAERHDDASPRRRPDHGARRGLGRRRCVDDRDARRVGRLVGVDLHERRPRGEDRRERRAVRVGQHREPSRRARDRRDPRSRPAAPRAAGSRTARPRRRRPRRAPRATTRIERPPTPSPSTGSPRS